MDFTLSTYEQLLKALISKGFFFQTFSEYLTNPRDKVVILRHDVDNKKLNSLRFAKIQAEYGIKGTYYFRIVPQSWDEKVIREIHHLGHEIGYHYETMDTMAKWQNGKMKNGKMRYAKSERAGLVGLAYQEFCRNLEVFRRIVPVETVCMHGSPRSKFDNREIWQKYDYRKLGIIGEPYFDIDFNKVAYLTDTGRMWDGEKFSVRDKVGKSEYRILNDEYRMLNKKKGWPAYHSTIDIISAFHAGTFPDQVMMTFHPQRWTDQKFLWTKELIFQNLKNQVKRFLVK